VANFGQVLRRSDNAGTVVHGPVAFPASLAAGTTTSIEVRGWTHVEWHIENTTHDTTTDIEVEVDYSFDNTNWSRLAVEEIDLTATPIATQKVYSVDADGVFASSGDIWTIPVPVHGRYMRLLLLGNPIGSDTVTVTAYRRTS